MSRSLAVVLATLVASVAHANPGKFSPDDYAAQEPVVVYNLAVIPLHTRKLPPWDDYTVLEEAQKGKKFAIREVEGGDVPHLSVLNKDSRPLYLLGGELLLGGKQDRMVMADTIVDPRRRLEIEVRCVEQGRWDGDLTFHNGSFLAHPDLRKAALFGSQGEVWSEVARKSQVSGVASDTGTFRRVFQDAKLRKKIDGYLDELQKKIPRDDRLTGLAVAIDGELEVIDLFDSPLLYAKLERKLLASYVLAALERQPRTGKAAAESLAKAKALKQSDIAEVMNNDETTSRPGGDLQSNSGPRPGKTTSVYERAGKAIHGTFFKTGRK